MKLLFLLTTLTLMLSANESLNQKDVLDAHNQWRKSVNVKPLTYSLVLEKEAKTWAKVLQSEGCQMRHSGPGENLFWASPAKSATQKNDKGEWIWHSAVQKITPKDAINAWGNEVQWYDYDTNSCHAPKDESCGHYTQVIWHTTKEVGCAMAICDDKSQVWVCEYLPYGNIMGKKPY